jgi:hypothetical protein
MADFEGKEEESSTDSDHSDSSSDIDIVDYANMAFKYDMRGFGLKYTGGPTDDLDTFIAKFRNYAQLKDYTDAKAILALNSIIDGHARVYLDRIPDTEKNTVAKIHALLKGYFEGKSWLWGVESQLLTRKQQPSETLDDYASDIMLWGRQTKKTDAELMSIFMRGLLPTVRAFVFSKQPESFSTALDAARLAISVSRVADELPTSSHDTGSQPHVSVNATSSALENLTGLVSNISSRLENVEKNMNATTRNPQRNSRPTRSIVCFRCGYTGHKWRNCYARKGIDGRPLN